jgi:hypothetical protein
LLSRKERDLASAMRLYPQQYLILKDAMIRESARLGGLKKSHAKAMVKIGTYQLSFSARVGLLFILLRVPDSDKALRLWEFLLQHGWITNGDAPPVLAPPPALVPMDTSGAVVATGTAAAAPTATAAAK